MTWNEFQHSNKGRWTKRGMSAAWERYKKSYYPNGGKHYLHRPTLRQSTKNIINSRAIIDSNTGWVYDEYLGRYMPGPYDYGHVPDNEFHRLRDDAEARGLTQAEFNDEVNKHPEWFFIQNREINQSHMAEVGYLADPVEQQRRLDNLVNGILGRYSNP